MTDKLTPNNSTVNEFALGRRRGKSKHSDDLGSLLSICFRALQGNVPNYPHVIQVTEQMHIPPWT